ncbi:MAG: stage II sporulation protein M [Steroidobacteraceae bacterium]
MNAVRAWVAMRAAGWSELRQNIADLRQHRRLTIDAALQSVESYRSLARDLASARHLLPGTRVTAGLESLYAQLHEMIRHKPHGGRAAWLTMFRSEIPQIVTGLRGRITWITVLLVLSAAAGWWLITEFPELITLIASEQMIQKVEGGKLWTDDLLNITPSSLLSVRIFSNNIAVSVFAVCAGFLFGLGTFYIIATNGLMLGGIFAFTHQHGMATRLFEFIVAHGLVELSVICIAGAIGAAIGDSLIRPTHGTRRESFQQCMQGVGPLILLCAFLLIGAGLIEGFVSPDPTFPMISRVVIGVSYWVLMVMALNGRLFGRAQR